MPIEYNVTYVQARVKTKGTWTSTEKREMNVERKWIPFEMFKKRYTVLKNDARATNRHKHVAYLMDSEIVSCSDVKK